MVGYIPIGFAFGVLARKAEISAFNTVLMSLVVYAGSSQLIAVGLILTGATAVSIVFTTLIVNLRHMLMSAALSPYLKKWRVLQLIVFSYEITDESFAIHAERFTKGDTESLVSISLNVFSQGSWVFGTILGILASGLISDVKPFALDYALVAMFIGLLVFQLKTRIQVLTCIISGILSVVLLMVGLDQWNVIVATLICATLGILLEKWINPKSH